MMSNGRRIYLEDVLKVKKEDEKRYLDAMAKYPFPWWESDDPAQVVRFQLNEPLPLVLFWKFQDSLEAVLKRAVRPDEISFKNLRLKEEAFAAIAAMV